MNNNFTEINPCELLNVNGGYDFFESVGKVVGKGLYYFAEGLYYADCTDHGID